MTDPLDPVHHHPTVQRLLKDIWLHRVALVVVGGIAIVLVGFVVWDHLLKAAPDFQ